MNVLRPLGAIICHVLKYIQDPLCKTENAVSRVGAAFARVFIYMKSTLVIFLNHYKES